MSSRDCRLRDLSEREPRNRRGDISDALDEARKDGCAIMWIGLHEPTEAEFGLVTGELQLHPLAVEDAVVAPLEPVRRRLESAPELLRCGPSAVLYAVCDKVVDNYGVIAHHIESDIIVLERKVFAPKVSDVAEEIWGYPAAMVVMCLFAYHKLRKSGWL